MEPFINKLKAFLSANSFSTEQIYNCNETGLLWRGILNKTLDNQNMKPSGLKASKERVTLLLCANAKGTHRLPLLFIHNAAKPRCLKNNNMNNLPVHYYNQSSSWMTLNIFEEWFHKHFVPSVEDYFKSISRNQKQCYFMIMHHVIQLS